MSHWEGAEDQAQQQQLTLSRAPELQKKRYERDEWDIEYDKGRVKKVKAKDNDLAVLPFNPFQVVQNQKIARKVSVRP